MFISVGLAAALLVGALVGALWSEGASPDAPTRTFADVYAETSSGIVRVDTVSCGGTGIGSGFLVSETSALTSSHVVENAVSIAVSNGDVTTTAEVVGFDSTQDLALLRLAQPIDGHAFTFSSAEAAPGMEIAAMGYPLGAPLSLSRGAISGVGRTLEGREGSGLLQTDTAMNPGNSGGPLVDLNGHVLGVVTGASSDGVGLGYAVPAPVASVRVEQWTTTPSAHEPEICDLPLGPDQEVVLETTDSVRDPDVIDIFTAYFGGINRGDYRLAWDQLGPEVQNSTTLDAFAANVSTTYDFDLSVEAYTVVDDDTHRLWIRFTSLQDPTYGPDGESCTRWSVDYTVQRIEATWRIVAATGHDGPIHVPC